MIYFVRHGSTDWNDNKDANGNKAPKCQGRVDISLNEKGIKEAEETRDKLKDIKFDYVFCSPLKRTIETCNIIAGGRGNN